MAETDGSDDEELPTAESPVPKADSHAGRRAPPNPGSIPTEDLTGDRALRGCRTIEWEGVKRPSLGRIALLARLGKGGMGTVYYGVNPRLGTEVAVKILSKSDHDEYESLIDRFVREARLAAKLRSEHLVGVLDVDRDEDSGSHFLVMEYVRGQSAGAWLRGLVKAGEPGAPEAAALDVCIAATKGLAAAHLAGIVHRDIKPDNVLLPADAAGRLQFAKAKLADLGLARPEIGAESLTGNAVALGTPGYMAPEQAQDAKRAKKPADVFGIGASLYALLAGKSPFSGTTPMDALLRTIQTAHVPIRELRPDVSPATAELLDHCLAKDPSRRYADAPALLEALELCRAALSGVAGKSDDAVPLVASLVQREERGQRVKTDPSGSVRSETAEPASASVTPVASAPASDPRHGTASGSSVSSRPSHLRRGSFLLACVAALVIVVALAVSKLLPQADKEDAVPPGADARHAAGAPAPPAPEGAEPGLYVASDPSGAAVSVDGRHLGMTPLLVEDLATGRHSVEIVLPYYAPFETAKAESKKGERTELRTTLVRALGKVAVEGGAPGAKATLIRDGDPPKSYEFVLDATGRLAAVDCEAGTYAVSVSHEGFDAYSGKTEVLESKTATVTAVLIERTALLSVRSTPPGAEVLVDDTVVGRTPLAPVRVRAGTRTIRLHLSEHSDIVKPMTFVADRTLDLGDLELSPWATLDLTAVGADVTVTLAGKLIVGRVAVEPGRVFLVVSRAGYAQQSLELNPTAGEVVLVQPKPWTEFQACLDLLDLPPDATATIDGRSRSGVIPFAAPGTVEVVVSRPGFESQTVKAELVFGRRTTLALAPWTPSPGSLDLSAFGAGVRFEVDGAAVADRVTLLSGKHSVVALRDGFRSQMMTVDVRAGAVARPALGEWVELDHPQRVVVDLGSGASITMLLVPAGTFTMGSESDQPDERPVHQVTFTRPFYLAETEVTQAQWRAVLGTSPSSSKGDDFPVERVMWDECQEFLKKVSARIGGARLRLPSESEWEYASRAARTTGWCFGDDESRVGEYAWNAANSGGATHPVKQKAPNDWGFYDMHGNVWEWCEDSYQATYSGAPADGRAWVVPGVSYRVFRGGCWASPGRLTRSAFRNRLDPGSRLDYLGFRPARSISPE